MSRGGGYAAVRARLPWVGPRGPRGTTGGYSDYTKGRLTWRGVHAELHARRSDAELERLLAERLAELRANPPRGYPG